MLYVYLPREFVGISKLMHDLLRQMSIFFNLKRKALSDEEFIHKLPPVWGR
jgi:hypothetical protein